jgi:hypothetical protein
MKAMLDISQNTYRAIAPPLNPFEFVSRKDATQGKVSQPTPPAGKRRPQGAKDSDDGEVRELKERLAELETIVSKLAPKKAPRKRK